MTTPRIYECVEAVQTPEFPSAPPKVVATGTYTEMREIVLSSPTIPLGLPGSRWVREVLPLPARQMPADQDMW